MLDQSKVALGISPEGRPVPIQLTAAGLLAVSGGSGGAGNGAFVDGYVLIGIAPDGTRVPISVDSSGVIQTGGSSGGSGTVTSVAMTVPNILSVSGSPIIGAGTLAVTLANQSANVVFAGPVSGGAAVPTFRSLVTADLGTSLAVQHASLTLGGALVTGSLFSIPVAAVGSSNYGQISLGAGPFDGTTSGFFVGNSNGTYLAINTTAGYLGRMADFQVGGVRMFGVGRGSQASATSATLNAIDIPSFTVTITGNTAITTAAGFNYTFIGAPTYSAASALTITNAGTFVLGGAPIGGGAGPATITNPYTFWVLGGTTRFDGREVNTTAGAASAPAQLLSGTIFTGGSGTTTRPHLLVEPTGTTSTIWSTGGTLIGANAPSGFGGDLLALQLNGAVSMRVSNIGSLTLNSGLATGAGSSVTTGGIGSVTGSGNLGVMANGTNGTVSLGDMGGFPGSVGGGILNLYRGSGGTVSAEFKPPAVAGGRTGLLITPGAHTAVVAEVIDNSFAAHTMTITGGYSNQRFSLFAQPTITAASGLTVVNAATLAIAGAPIAAGSAVITNAYALWSQAGALRFDGNSYTPQAGALLYVMATTGSGANNPATAAQNGWLQLEDATGKFWVPVWR